MSEYPKAMIWTQWQVSDEIPKHRDDDDWNPLEVQRLGDHTSLFVVKKLNGELVPPPQPNTYE